MQSTLLPEAIKRPIRINHITTEVNIKYSLRNGMTSFNVLHIVK